MNSLGALKNPTRMKATPNPVDDFNMDGSSMKDNHDSDFQIYSHESDFQIYVFERSESVCRGVRLISQFHDPFTAI